MRNPEKRGKLDDAVKQAGVGERIVVDTLDVTNPVSMESCVPRLLDACGGASMP